MEEEVILRVIGKMGGRGTGIEGESGDGWRSKWY